MPKNEVKTFCPSDFDHPWFFQDVENAIECIRQRAHQLFSCRCELDDWFNAERDLFFSPAAELTETGTEFVLKASVPGYRPEEITVAVEPKCVTLRGHAHKEEEQSGEKLIFSEYRGKELFRRVTFPHDVNPETAKAVYEHGMLTVTLPKAAIALLNPASKAAKAA